MKNQFFGDINDFYKYGLLRSLAASGLSIGVCWMLTPDDGGSAGKKLKYLEDPDRWRARDPELYDALKRACSEPGGRSVARAREVLANSRFFEKPVPRDRELRQHWWQEALESLGGTDLIFLDPDNGIEPQTAGSSEKHVCWHEIEEAWRRGSSLVIFQYFPIMKRRDPFIRELRERLAHRTGSTEVHAVASPNVLFLVAAQAPHRTAVAKSLEGLRRRGWDLVGDDRAGSSSTKQQAERLVDGGWHAHEIDLFTISTPRQAWVSARLERPDPEVAQLLKERDYDWAPVQSPEGVPVGIISSQFVNELGLPDPAAVERGHLPRRLAIGALLDKLIDRGAYLVADNSDGPTHLITRSDLNRHPVRARLYEILAELEAGLALILERRFSADPWDWLGMLPRNRQARLAGYWEVSKRERVDIGPFASADLGDLLVSLSKVDDLRAEFGFPREADLNQERDRIVRLRNKVMHPVQPLVSTAEEIAEMLEVAGLVSSLGRQLSRRNGS
jgi:hypothetical protein